MVRTQPSPELIAANERLLHLRAQYQAERIIYLTHGQLDLSTYREAMGGNQMADRLELTPAGGDYAARF